MMARLTSIGLALMVAGCEGQAPTPAGRGDDRAQRTDAADGKADCAVGVDAAWRQDCPVERDGTLLTIRHADGGFRRFHILDDGRGLESADGAEQAKVQIIDAGRIEVRVGGDRYRLPAQIARQGGR